MVGRLGAKLLPIKCSTFEVLGGGRIIPRAMNGIILDFHAVISSNTAWITQADWAGCGCNCSSTVWCTVLRTVADRADSSYCEIQWTISSEEKNRKRDSVKVRRYGLNLEDVSWYLQTWHLIHPEIPTVRPVEGVLLRASRMNCLWMACEGVGFSCALSETSPKHCVVITVCWMKTADQERKSFTAGTTILTHTHTKL